MIFWRTYQENKMISWDYITIKKIDKHSVDSSCVCYCRGEEFQFMCRGIQYLTQVPSGMTVREYISLMNWDDDKKSCAINDLRQSLDYVPRHACNTRFF